MDQSAPFVKASGPNWSFIYGEGQFLVVTLPSCFKIDNGKSRVRTNCFYISFSTSAEHSDKIHAQVTPFSKSRQTELGVLEWKSLNLSTELQINGDFIELGTPPHTGAMTHEWGGHVAASTFCYRHRSFNLTIAKDILVILLGQTKVQRSWRSISRKP